MEISRRGLFGSLAAAAAMSQLTPTMAGAEDGAKRAAKLFYTDAGHGRNVMMLHGWLADSHDWSWQLPVFQDRYRTVAVDFRGHGRSEVMPSGHYRPSDYAFDIISLIETTFAGEKFILVGHSMGGQIAARIAGIRPDVVAAVISVDGSLGFDQKFAPLFQDTAERLQAEDPVKVTSEMLESFADPETPPALKIWHQRRMMGMPMAPFRESFGPLFIGDEQIGVGAQSEAFIRSLDLPFYHLCRFQEQADAMSGWFRNGRSKAESWDRASHWIMQDRPDDVNSALIDWIDTLPS